MYLALDATHTHNRKHRQQRQVGQRLVRAGRALLALPVWLLRRFLALPLVRRVRPQALPPRRRSLALHQGGGRSGCSTPGAVRYGPGWGSPLQEASRFALYRPKFREGDPQYFINFRDYRT